MSESPHGIAHHMAITETLAARGAVRRILLGESTYAIEAERLGQSYISVWQWVTGTRRRAETLDPVMAELDALGQSPNQAEMFGT